jgi:hypothetical protein
MNNKVIEDYDSQYSENGGNWNKKTCLKDGKIETFSGPGSLLENTDLLRENLNIFIKDFEIKSIIDIPCGDFNYMSKINLDNIDYIGLDISQNAINRCNNKVQKSNIKFNVFDATNENLPYADLIIIKDLFLHLCFSDIQKILDNVKSSGCKYLAVSRYAHGNEPNKDQASGIGARTIEVTKEPFNFNYPLIYKTYYTSLHLTTKTWMKDEMIFLQIN